MVRPLVQLWIFKTVPYYIHVHADPDPDTTNATNPPPPDYKPENLVRLKSSLFNISSFSDSFVWNCRIPNRTPLRIPIHRAL